MDRLSNLAFWLEGIKVGKGDILPLGLSTIDSLWKAIRTLNGSLNDPRVNPRDGETIE